MKAVRDTEHSGIYLEWPGKKGRALKTSDSSGRLLCVPHWEQSRPIGKLQFVPLNKITWFPRE